MAVKPREKVLAVIVAGLVAVFILQVVIKGLFLEPITDIGTKITSAQKSIEKLQGKMGSKAQLIGQWRDAYALTIADNPEQARGRLKLRINTLVDRAGLKEKKLTPQSTRVKKADGVESYYPIAVTLTCKGTLQEIVTFFDMLNEEPYLIKAKGFTLNPMGNSNNMVRLTSCRIEAMVLARTVLEKADGGDRTVPDTLPEPKPTGQYARIFEKDILHRPTKTAQVKPKPSQSGQKRQGWRQYARRGQDRDPQPARRSEGAREGDLVGAVVHGKTGGIYLRNSTGAQWYKIGDRVDRFVLEFVHPLGAVFKDSGGGYQYVEIGTNIDQACPLKNDDGVGGRLLNLFKTWRSAGPIR